MRELLRLYKIHSPSRGEEAMVDHIRRYCVRIRNCEVVVDGIGNVYVTKKKRGYTGTFPCIVAHTDQVQNFYSKDYSTIVTDINGKKVIFGYSRSCHRFEGLGADDKNGIWVALKMLEEFDNVKAAFFVSEEIGCIGSCDADMDFFSDCRFVVECDRRGNSDFVTNISCQLCSAKFLKDAKIGLFGYHASSGLSTDVNTLVCNGIGISCCNISCGYYEPHTVMEHTVIDDLEKCLNLVRHIFRNCKKVYRHEVHPLVPQYGGYYRTYDSQDSWMDVDAYDPYEWLFNNVDVNAYAGMTDEELDKAYSEDVEPWLTQEQLSHADWKSAFKDFVNDSCGYYVEDAGNSLFRS